ncbi:bifunctional precorrin-2 dehydrogenase/sirohydrochlorin ferrochelatase, partial [archaeon]|nr:bifunctional precorrin-2 dehydrogenase/sirohydrochlorin ferrochelatase [archaeon]
MQPQEAHDAQWRLPSAEEGPENHSDHKRLAQGEFRTAMKMNEKTSPENFYYPLFVDLRGKAVVVVGGGIVALRKIEALQNTGALVKVISPEVMDEIDRRADIEIIKRRYAPGDLEGASLVIAATDDEQVNIAVSRAASENRIFCNVVDKPDLCSFIVPSVVEKGPIKVAISTGGISPTLSKRLRMEIGSYLGEEYATLALIMGRIRPMVIAGCDGF